MENGLIRAEENVTVQPSDSWNPQISGDKVSVSHSRNFEKFSYAYEEFSDQTVFLLFS